MNGPIKSPKQAIQRHLTNAEGNGETPEKAVEDDRRLSLVAGLDFCDLVVRPSRNPALRRNGRYTKLTEDVMALAFVENHSEYRYVAQRHRWLKWDGKRWGDDSTDEVYDAIRKLVRTSSAGRKAERATASASFVGGIERLLRTDRRIVVSPAQLDADPWLLNTGSGIVDLRTGHVREHDRKALCTKITNASVDHTKVLNCGSPSYTESPRGTSNSPATCSAPRAMRLPAARPKTSCSTCTGRVQMANPVMPKPFWMPWATTAKCSPPKC